MTRIFTDKAETQGRAWASQAALPKQTLWQASLPTRLFPNRSIAPRVPRFGAPRASRLGEWEVGEGISLLIRGEFLEGQSQAGLQMDSQKLHIPRSAMGSDTFGDTSFDLRQPLGSSPCGPTSGCSSSRLPERSVVSISEI